MTQIKIMLVSLLLFLTPTFIFAATPILVPAWQTKAIFEQPESVVYYSNSNQLLVSNVNGDPTKADGNGYISLLSIDGNVIKQHWLDGLNAPKGMTIVGNKLYIADINELIVIDIANNKTNNIVGSIVKHYSAPNAKFLNDVAADQSGHIYVSDMLTNSIYRLANDTFSLWLHDDALEAPNGLLAEGSSLIVASWGNMTDGFATDIPGHLKRISITKHANIKSYGDAMPVGNLDGIEPDGNGNYYVTDWMSGKLLHISPSGRSSTLISLEQGSADHTVILDKNLIIIPMMLTGKLIAFEIKK